MLYHRFLLRQDLAWLHFCRIMPSVSKPVMFMQMGFLRIVLLHETRF